MASLNPKTTPLSEQQAAHLLRRATFGPSKALLNTYTGLTPQAAFQQLIQPTPNPLPPVHPSNGTNWTIDFNSPHANSASNQLRNCLRRWWIDAMIKSDTLLEKMVLFYHTHFTVRGDKVLYSTMLYQQNALFRLYAFGSFKTLVRKICTDTCMSFFLDNYNNRVGQPNENFARELLELYTIGKGEQVGPGDYTTYTDADIETTAKVLSGHVISGISDFYTDSETGLLATEAIPDYHDSTDKTFSIRFQNTTIPGRSDKIGMLDELDELVEMVLSQPTTAQHIVRKLYRFFVHYKVDSTIESDIIAPLAQILINNNYEILPVLETLLTSVHFYDEDDTNTGNDIIGAMVKSPIDIAVGTARHFNWQLPDMTTDTSDFYEAAEYFSGLSILGEMKLFDPPQTAGWPAYYQPPVYNRNWMSTTTLVNRYRYTTEVFTADIPLPSGNIFQLDHVAWINNSDHISNPADPNVLIQELTSYLFPNGANTDRVIGYKFHLTDGLDDVYWLDAWGTYINTGDDSVVRPRLMALFAAIFQSPEFQLS